MPSLYFIQADGGQYDAEGAVGQTLLQAAEESGVDGFFAECGGSGTCGTCHCYIDPAQLALLPAPASAELEMLDFVADERRPNSRLACQVKLTAQLEGLKVQIPARQI